MHWSLISPLFRHFNYDKSIEIYRIDFGLGLSFHRLIRKLRVGFQQVFRSRIYISMLQITSDATPEKHPNIHLPFTSENFATKCFSLNRVRIIETHLYFNLLWSIVIFIRYALRIQYTPMIAISLMRSNTKQRGVAREPHELRHELRLLRLMVAIAWANCLWRKPG